MKPMHYTLEREEVQALLKQVDSEDNGFLGYNQAHRLADLVCAALQLKNEKAAQVALQNEPENCECHRCIKEKNLTAPGPFGGLMPLSNSKMILCPECGNKRCPKASDHRLDCTQSNEPNQPGSVYSVVLAVPQTPEHRLTREKALLICQSKGFGVTGVVLTGMDGQKCTVDMGKVMWDTPPVQV